MPGLKINQLSWNVVPPPDYSITSQKTNMQMQSVSRPVPAFMKLYDSIRQIHFPGILSPLSTVVYKSRRLQTGMDFQGGTSQSMKITGGAGMANGPVNVREGTSLGTAYEDNTQRSGAQMEAERMARQPARGGRRGSTANSNDYTTNAKSGNHGGAGER